MHQRLQGCKDVHACAGFLYPPGDYGAATAYVRKLVEDATLRAQMGREARLEVCWCRLRSGAALLLR
jgi:hypothetical protein